MGKDLERDLNRKELRRGETDLERDPKRRRVVRGPGRRGRVGEPSSENLSPSSTFFPWLWRHASNPNSYCSPSLPARPRSPPTCPASGSHVPFPLGPGAAVFAAVCAPRRETLSDAAAMSHFGRAGPPDIRDTYSLLVLNITFRMSPVPISCRLL